MKNQIKKFLKLQFPKIKSWKEVLRYENGKKFVEIRDKNIIVCDGKKIGKFKIPE